MADSQKQTVQWFPGHMAKTRRLIKEGLSSVDAVVELLDARIPMSSRNPEIEQLTASKPHIILLNKADIADDKTTKLWINYFKGEKQRALAVDCRSGKGLGIFSDVVKDVLKERIEANEQRGMAGKPLRLMIVGIPNTGKSSFINRMAGKTKAKVADKPGVTRQNQWFAIGNGLELLDTPGVLWPKFDDAEVGDKLAFIGSVKDEILDSETIACRLIDALARDYTQLLTQRYKLTQADIDEAENSYELLELIGRKRGMLIRGGEVDTQRASCALLDEYRAGKLGKLSLEKPPKAE